MLNKIIFMLFLCSAFLSVHADTIDVNPDHPDSYVVQKGDTLWDIAGHFLQQPWRWPEIWQVNPQIADPHLIYPGDVVTLSYQGESPVLTVDRPEEVEQQPVESVTASRDVKLSPTIRQYERGDAISAIPIEAIRNFLSRPMAVLNEDEIDASPYIVSSYEQHLVAGEGSRVYVRGLNKQSANNRYAVYRKGPAYTSRRHGKKILGYEFLHVADATIVKHGDPATAMITQSTREVLNGDRLLPLSEQEVSSDFIPRSPGNAIEGSIISMFDGLAEIGQYQIVVLDLGNKDGLEVGNVLGIYQSGHLVTDKFKSKKSRGFNSTALVEYLGKPKSAGEPVRLPEEYTGVVMVFRVFDRVSYALVMEAYGPAHIHDTVRNL